MRILCPLPLAGNRAVSDESDIIRRCCRGDEAAFAELVDQHKVMVFNLVDRMVQDRDATEDLAQEVFVRVYRGLERFRGEARLSTWIYQITYRVCLEELQRPHRRQSYISLDRNADDPGPDPASATDRAFARVEHRDTVDRGLAKLPPPYKMVLTLYYLQERSYQEIAAIMELPMGTVKTYLHRAKKYLRTFLLDEGNTG